MRALSWTFALSGLLASSPAWGGEEYRRILSADGRSFVARIVESRAAGLRLEVPQGETEVTYASLTDMGDADRAAYDGQDDWYVYLAGEATSVEHLESGFLSIPGVQLLGRDGPRGLPLAESTHEAVHECAMELACLRGALAVPGRWAYVVVVSGQEDAASVAVTTTTAPEGGVPRHVRGGIGNAEAAWRLAHESLGLAVPDEAPPMPDLVAEESTASDAEADAREVEWMRRRRRARWLSFVPLPGLPSMVEGDAVGASLAWAMAAPLSTGWVLSTGGSSTSLAEHASIAAAGCYVATVAANQIFGVYSVRRTIRREAPLVGVVPTPEGGVLVTVVGAW